jgi:NAD+ synthase
MSKSISSDLMRIDASSAVAEISRHIREDLKFMRRRGAVLGVSGGIDSSVCAALCARALGREKVLAIFMPDRDSSPDSIKLGRLLTETLGIEAVTEDITDILDAAGCYERQTEAIRKVFPAYGPGWKSKIGLPPPAERDRLNLFRLTVETPDGLQHTSRMPVDAYLQIVAATNMKQRQRKAMEYYHADRLNYAVCGTPNRLEYDQGFFVKNGDGSADFKPIAHLYKSQVYQLARELGVPSGIIDRTPTTDTYSLAQTQEEFFFTLPYEKMDLCLFALNNGIDAADVADAVGLTAEQVSAVFRDIESKRATTRYLHLPPILVNPVSGINQNSH